MTSTPPRAEPTAPGVSAAVAAWVRAEPDAVAVIDGGVMLSRRDLLTWSDDLAAVLRRLAPCEAVEGPELCTLLLPRSWAVPFGLVAARAAGLAFLLLDEAEPEARLERILAAARPGLLLTREGTAVPPAGRHEAEIAPPHPGLERLRLTSLPLRRRLPPGASHLVFTSGSSGAPKGVILSEAPLLRTAQAQRRLLGVDTPGSRAPSLWALSPGFDASLSDIFCALLGQAPLLVLRDSPTRRGMLRAAIAKHGAARADLAPSLMRILDPALLGLSAVVFGGERCEAQTARRWGAATLALQAYGPAEAAVCAMMARAGPDWRDGLLGRPLDHQIVLLSAGAALYRVMPREACADPSRPEAFNATRLEPFANGPAPPAGSAEGEIWLAGEAVALGYLDAAEEEARRFGRIGSLRVFRTGDLARWSEGALLWLGRLDRQLKVRGRRLAPEEVEAAVGEVWPGACVCAPWRQGIAIALEPDGVGKAAPAAVLAAVTERFGRALRPKAVVVLDPWPRLGSGKTDVGAVTQAMTARQAAETAL